MSAEEPAFDKSNFFPTDDEYLAAWLEAHALTYLGVGTSSNGVRTEFVYARSPELTKLCLSYKRNGFVRVQTYRLACKAIWKVITEKRAERRRGGD